MRNREREKLEKLEAAFFLLHRDFIVPLCSTWGIWNSNNAWTGINDRHKYGMLISGFDDCFGNDLRIDWRFNRG